MDIHIDTISILAELTIAFVAFATITASIKLSIGRALSDYQRLVIHYITESAMISISIMVLALVLLEFMPEEERLVSTIVCFYAFISCAMYMTWYMRRRIRIKAPTSITSLLVILGYLTMIILLAVTISGVAWKPRIEIVSAVGAWNLVGAGVIFSSFLGSFIDPGSHMESERSLNPNRLTQRPRRQYDERPTGSS